MSLLVGCAGSSATLESDGSKLVASRYRQAREAYIQHMAPLAQYFVKTCSPLADRDYLDCINNKRSEIAALSIYPERPETAQQRQILEQRLLNGEIDRKQFRSQLEAIKGEDENAQLARDLASGVYSGRY